MPPGWHKQDWGSPKYDFTVVEQDGQRAIHLMSASDSSNVNKDVRGKVHLAETPILEWTWKVVALPKGADARNSATDDQAAQLYVVWPRFPQAVHSRVIGYIWDTTAPAGSIVKSQKTSTVTYVVVRSGPTDLGRWITEHRDVREDFKRIYGEAGGSWRRVIRHRLRRRQGHRRVIPGTHSVPQVLIGVGNRLKL
jgi:hypothetical protein